MGDSNNVAGDGPSSARLMALLSRHNVQNDVSTVLYMSAEWTAPLNSILVPFIQQKLSPNETLVVLRRGEHAALESVGSLSISCDQREFQDVCRDLEISRLPMIAVVNSNSGPRGQLSDSGSPIQQLMEAMRQSPNVHKWTVPVERAYPRLNTDAPALVTLREEATARFEQGDLVGGAIGFMSALVHCPTCPKANFNMAVILQMMDEMYFAVDHMLRVVTENDQDAVAHTVLRTVLHPAEPELVVRGYESIVANHEDHVRAAHSLATIRGEATTAAPAYVRQVFDHLAETFEDKLVNHLEYRVPWQIVDALQRVNALPPSRDQEPFTAVDLGCGTGLCGRLLRPFVSHIAGMDLSPLMIEKTRESGFYDHAETGDIVPFLSSKAADSLDLVISADVWIYVGDLGEIFPLVAQKLRPRRWFAFSTELLAADDGFQLASSGRFQHSDRYISSLGAHHGFTISVQEDIAVRKESGEPIAGRVFVLQLQP